MRRFIALVVGAGVALLATAFVLSDPGHLEVERLPIHLKKTYIPTSVYPNRIVLPPEGPSAGRWTLTIGALPFSISSGGSISITYPAQVLGFGAPESAHLYCSQSPLWMGVQTSRANAPRFISLDPLEGHDDIRLRHVGRMAFYRVLAGILHGKGGGILDYSVKEALCHINTIQILSGSSGIPKGTVLRIHYGDKDGRGPGWNVPKVPTSAAFGIRITDAPDGEEKVVFPPPVIHFEAHGARSFRVVAPSVSPVAEAQEIIVQAVDALGRHATDFQGTLRLSAYSIPDGSPLWSGGVKGEARVSSKDEAPPASGDLTEIPRLFPRLPQPVDRAAANAGEDGWKALPGTWSIDEADRGQKRFTLDSLGPGTWQIQVRSGNMVAYSNVFQRREDEPPVLWGDLHRHSIIADGWASPKEVYRRARDEELLDFASLSEHSHPDPMDLFGDLRRRVILSPSEWKYLREVTDAFNSPDHFVSIMGYEWSSKRGHRNVYFAPGESPGPLLRATVDDAGAPALTPSEFLKVFDHRRVVIIPHHPAFQPRDGRDYDWGEEDIADRLQRLVEVYSQHGNSEYHDAPRPIHGRLLPPPGGRLFKMVLGRSLLGPSDQAPPDSESFVQKALIHGRRMGLIASSDNHFYPRGPLTYPSGLVAVRAKNKTRQAIWKGLFLQNVYGTTGARILINAHLSPVPASASAETNPPADATKPRPSITAHSVRVVPSNQALLLSLEVCGTAPLEKVSLLRFDPDEGLRGIAEWRSATNLLRVRLSLDPMSPESFVYARVEQTDTELAWIGPWWGSEQQAGGHK